jgi:hypothetical protein
MPKDPLAAIKAFVENHTSKEMLAALNMPLYDGLKMMFPDNRAKVLACVMYKEMGYDDKQIKALVDQTIDNPVIRTPDGKPLYFL